MKSNISGGMAAVLVVVVIAIIAVVAWKMFSGPGISAPSAEAIKEHTQQGGGGSNNISMMKNMKPGNMPGGMGRPPAPARPAGQ